MAKKNIRKEKRSGNAACPICSRTAPLVEHHIHGREVHRWNETWNTVFLCGTCHDQIHSDIQNQIIVIGWFMTTYGRELIWYRKNEKKPDELLDEAEPHIYGK